MSIDRVTKILTIRTEIASYKIFLRFYLLKLRPFTYYPIENFNDYWMPKNTLFWDKLESLILSGILPSPLKLKKDILFHLETSNFKNFIRFFFFFKLKLLVKLKILFKLWAFLF